MTADAVTPWAFTHQAYPFNVIHIYLVDISIYIYVGRKTTQPECNIKRPELLIPFQLGWSSAGTSAIWPEVSTAVYSLGRLLAGSVCPKRSCRPPFS